MARTFADMDLLVQTKLADTAGTIFLAAERTYQFEECLKEFAQYIPHIVTIPFKIESRYGTATATSANNLVDTTKSQFLSTDPAAEKVVYNPMDETWATIISAATTLVSVGLSADIFASGEDYRIYNKRCINERQFYIGDILPEILTIESVEYPFGQKRNFKIVSEGVVELDVDVVSDSNSTISPAPDVDVLVRVFRPQVLSQMTDLGGTVSGTAAAKAATTMSVSGLTVSGTVKAGNEFTIATHRQSYVVTANATASTAGIATISFYPGLEAVASSASVVSFISSTLKPHEEEVLADLIAGRLMENKAPKYITKVSVGGASTWRNYLEAGRIKVANAQAKLKASSYWKSYNTYPRD